MRKMQVAHEVYPHFAPLGEAAILVRWVDAIDLASNARVLALLAALDRQPIAGIIDLIPAYASLLVIFDPLRVTAVALRRSIAARLAHLPAAFPNAVGGAIEIPVVYGGVDGPDLADVARELGITPAEVVRRHTAAVYRVYFLGFIAGFPYLGSAAASLVVPRLATPRTHVAAGSVGLADAQTGIYPITSPGGWRIIGRTAQRLFDPSRTPPTLLAPGDCVRFTAIAAGDAPLPDSTLTPPSVGVAVASTPLADAIPWLRVVVAGPLTSAQDSGRQGYGRYGISASGAADREAFLVGSALLGNHPDAAALELTLSGGVFVIAAPCVIALTGAVCTADVDGRIVQHGVATMVAGGACLTIGPMLTGARAYLHVTGGIALPPVLGSRATDLRAGLGGISGRALVAGDTLWRGRTFQSADHYTSRRITPEWIRRTPADGRWTLRVLPCDDDADAAEFAALLAAEYVVDPRADRMGVRLQRRNQGPAMGGQVLSAGVPRGAVQVPPGGDPIILLAEHQTTGGYRVPAVVISADQWMVAQMRPGDAVCFARTTQRAALLALRERQAAITALASAPLILENDLLMRGFCEAYDEGE